MDFVRVNGTVARTVRRHAGWIVAGLLAIGILVGVAVHRHHRYKHFAVHEAGRVYRSAWVDADVFGELIRKYKIRTVVNLCDPSEKEGLIESQRRAVQSAGARLVELVFPANHTWDINYRVVHEIEALFDDPSVYPVWIHCQHGRERTVKALTIYDIRRRRMNAYDSLESMPRYGMDHPWPVVVFAYNYETRLNSGLCRGITQSRSDRGVRR